MIFAQFWLAATIRSNMSSTKKKIKTKDGKEIEQEFLKFDPKEMITIVSNDGMEFVVDKRCAMISGTIKNMLTS